MIEVKANVAAGVVELGYQLENDARKIVFDISNFRKSFGEGKASVVAVRPGETESYEVKSEQSEDTLSWVVKEKDVEFSGNGTAQLKYTVGETVAKIQVFQTVIEKSISDPVAELPLDNIAKVKKFLSESQN